MLLSILGAWLMVRRINRPLLEASNAAASLGQGETPPSLNEQGPYEIAMLACSFNRMKGDLADLETNRRLMLAGISHDLRTPLARLRLAVEMNVGNERERDAMIHDLEDMDGLTKQFLDFARQESEEARQSINLNELVTSVANQFSSNGQSVIVSGQLGLASVRPQALKRALVNLLENAFLYGAPPVSIKLHQEDENCIIGVIDSGAGLAETELQSAKLPFYRGNAARTNAQGTGLGLAIVDRIARLHGGKLELLNRPEGGLEARFILPLT